jgi:outer membrane protein assembly factor BamB
MMHSQFVYVFRIMVHLSCVYFFVTGWPAHGEDWPRWRGPRQDGLSSETGLLREWPKEGPKRLWEYPLSGGFSSVAVADGKLFTQTKEKNKEIVLCLDAATGKGIWRHEYYCDYAQHPTFTGGGMPKSRTGPRATPAVDGGNVYAIGATGILVCLDAKTGSLKWVQDLLKIGDRKCHSHGYCNCPLVVGEHVYVQPGGTNGKSIAALNKHDGSIVWTALDDTPGQGTPVSTEIGGVAQIIYFTGKAAVGVAPENGKELWRYPWKTLYDLHIATPISSGSQVFISSNYGTGAAMFQVTDGRAETVWKSQAMQNHFTTSVLYRGNLYGFSDRRLRCVDFHTGKIRWDYNGLGKGSLVIADEHLILLGDDGQLVLAKVDPEKFVEVSRCQVFEEDTLTWIVPVLSNGILFVRSQDSLVALDLRNADTRPASK